MSPFVPVTAQELVFGYDDPLVSIAHRFFPKTRRPMSQMGLLLGVGNNLLFMNKSYLVELRWRGRCIKKFTRNLR